MIETWHVYIGERFIGIGRATESQIRVWFPGAWIIGRTVDISGRQHGA
jgi:hypothetical protein